MVRFERDHPDLHAAVKKWRATHPAGTLRDAVRDLELWPDLGDRDVQWYVWRRLYDQDDPVAVHAGFQGMRAQARGKQR